jgi:hypothetical protein
LPIEAALCGMPPDEPGSEAQQYQNEGQALPMGLSNLPPPFRSRTPGNPRKIELIMIKPRFFQLKAEDVPGKAKGRSEARAMQWRIRGVWRRRQWRQRSCRK